MYKLLSLTITNRIKNVLPRLIHQDQKGFMANRSITDNTRLMMDLILEVERQDESGLILLVDYEKAFDSLSWGFISKTLSMYNFGPKIINWIETLRRNSKSCIILNGHLSEYFLLGRGCRQGDPISPYLFILCGEILSTAIRNDKLLEGIVIHNKENKISQYADDTSLYLRDSEKVLTQALKALNWFYTISGLKINIKKTKVIRIGKIRESDRRYCREKDLEWVTEFVSLGITFEIRDMPNITNYNIDLKLIDIQTLLNAWTLRNITPIGRIKVAKSLALSKITHILLSLPSPSQECIQKLDKMFTTFIWRGKRHAVNKHILHAPLEMGGLNMIKIQDFDLGLKLTWLRKYIRSIEPWHEIATKLQIDRLFFVGPREISRIMVNCHNPFWKDVCRAAIKLYDCVTFSNPLDILKAPLWGNYFRNVPTQYSWFKYGVVEVGDIFREGLLLDRQELSDKVKSIVPVITYMGISNAIPRVWKQTIEENFLSTQNMALTKFQHIVLADRKGCRTIREQFQTKILETHWTNGWNGALTDIISDQQWSAVYGSLWKQKISPNTIYFQYQVINRTLVTNEKLMQFRIRDNDLCSYCIDDVETIHHLLYSCPLVLSLWEQVQKWCSDNNYNKIILEDKFILIGVNNTDHLTQTVVNITKHTIYKSKFKNKIPSLQQVLYTWKSCMEVEGYIAMSNNKYKTFLGKWSPIFKSLKEL